MRMFKMMILVKKKAGLSHAEFKDYYENNHVPLATRLTAPALAYRRNYIVKDDPFLAAMGINRVMENDDSFDAITEIVYETRAHAQEMLDIMQNTDNGPIIMEDEAKFCDRDRLRFYVVETHESEIR